MFRWTFIPESQTFYSWAPRHPGYQRLLAHYTSQLTSRPCLSSGAMKSQVPHSLDNGHHTLHQCHPTHSTHIRISPRGRWLTRSYQSCNSLLWQQNYKSVYWRPSLRRVKTINVKCVNVEIQLNLLFPPHCFKNFFIQSPFHKVKKCFSHTIFGIQRGLSNELK